MKNLNTLLITPFFILLISCGAKRNTPQTSVHSNDIQVVHLTNSALIQQEKNNIVVGANLDECRNHISEAICLVDPSKYTWDDKHPYDQAAADDASISRPCLPGGEEFAKYFTEHFDHSIPMIQRMYCSLSKIWIENQLNSTAYAKPIYENNKMISAGIGIRREFLESSIDLNTWFSWKEETSFGGTTSMTEGSAGKNLGLIKYNSPNNSKAFLIKGTINHEFGHLFDFTNNLNRFSECDFEKDPENCKPLAGSWGEISWGSSNTPLPEMNYPLRDKICFYWCEGNFINKDLSLELFDSLVKTNFHTIYASTNPNDDFAETFSYYLEVENDNFELSVTTQGQTIDLIKHFKSQRLQAKRDFVKNFISSKYVYPGQI